LTVDRAYSEEKKKIIITSNLEKSNYKETGKKSRGKLLEMCVRVKKTLAKTPAQAVKVTTTDSPLSTQRTEQSPGTQL